LTFKQFTGETTLKLLIAAGLVTLLSIPSVTLAQTRKRTTKKSSGAASSAPAKKSPVIIAGATRVADQVKNLTRYLYLLGGVAKGLEAADAAIQRKEASPAIVEQTQNSKATVKKSLQDIRAGLDKLEVDFRTTPELNRYYVRLAGVASGAAKAEEQAAANQFDKAGRVLLEVVNRLTDVLLEMQSL
jgi:hypothetical protein